MEVGDLMGVRGTPGNSWPIDYPEGENVVIVGGGFAFSTGNIFTPREARMECGIGKCSRCNIGHKYICKDGPVFSQAEADRLSKKD